MYTEMYILEVDLYLVRSGHNWSFQRRVPLDLVDALGTTPIRIPLTSSRALEARKMAVRLAAAADIFFTKLRKGGKLQGKVEGKQDHRDEMIQILEETLKEADELIALQKEEYESIIQINETKWATKSLEDAQRRDEQFQKHFDQLRSFIPDVQWAIDEIKSYQSKLGSKGGSTDEKLNSLTAMMEAMQGKLGVIDERTERAEIKPLDLLSVGLEAFLEKKRPELMRNKKESKYTSHTVRNAVQAFIEFAGDRPANHYKTSDIKDFNSFLASVPVNWKKKPQFRGLNIRQAAEKNASLKMPLDTLSAATVVRSYMTPLRGCIEALCINEERSPFDRVRVVAPKTARPSVEREPLTLAQVNKLLAAASTAARRPEDYWLPLLGFLTGARIGELAGIQGSDVKRLKEKFSEGHLMMLDPEDRPDSDPWLLDITTDILIEDDFMPGQADAGSLKEREVKNHGSRRLIAAHPILEDIGFIEWARTKRGPIFPQLNKAKDPADAASKRMARLFKKAGIRSGQAHQDVFHSLRHTTKDWLRDRKIDERVIDRQAGHRPEGEGGKYGAKLLRPKEICWLSAASLPENLDLSAYMNNGKFWSEKTLRTGGWGRK